MQLLCSAYQMRTVPTLVPLVCAVVVGACSPDVGAREDGTISVVTSFYPLRFAVERIGGDCVEVTNLTPPGVEPHDLELTPDGVVAIAQADVVLYIGGGFQPAIEGAIGEAEGRVVDVLGGVETAPAPAEEAAEGLTRDPHVWLDPGRFALIVDSVAGALEPAGAPGCDVAGNADRLADELTELDDAFRSGLADCELDVIVTTHAAFGYLAEAYGLRQEAIAGLEPEAEPSARRLAELEEFVRREGVTTVFSEELVSPDIAETLAAEAGVETALLFTIEGLTTEEVAAGEDYLSLMRENLDAIHAALHCS
jgi:zinc transport system substrate-binding protein